MSLIAELKRRNVFRVGAAYAIVAWLLIDGAHRFSHAPATGLDDHAGYGSSDHGLSSRPGDRLGVRDDT